jgi:hypothetical protein
LESILCRVEHRHDGVTTMGIARQPGERISPDDWPRTAPDYSRILLSRGVAWSLLFAAAVLLLDTLGAAAR